MQVAKKMRKHQNFDNAGVNEGWAVWRIEEVREGKGNVSEGEQQRMWKGWRSNGRT